MKQKYFKKLSGSDQLLLFSYLGHQKERLHELSSLAISK